MAITLTPPPPQSAQVLDSYTEQFSRPWSGWFRNIFNVLKPGVTKDVVVGGTTFHFVNGIFTGSSP